VARSAGTAGAALLAGATIAAAPRAGVVALGLLATAAAALAGLQRVATRLPALVVVLLAAEFLAASAGAGEPGQVAWTALEAAALSAVHDGFGLRDAVARASAAHQSLLACALRRTLSTTLVATPVVVLVVVLGHSVGHERWLEVLGALGALGAIGALAAQQGYGRLRRNR
jgi:hypothetical protein